jgi:hypothetical protein
LGIGGAKRTYSAARQSRTFQFTLMELSRDRAGLAEELNRVARPYDASAQHGPERGAVRGCTDYGSFPAAVPAPNFLTVGPELNEQEHRLAREVLPAVRGSVV